MGQFSTVFSDPVVIALTAVIQFLVIVAGVFIVASLRKIANKVGIDVDEKTEKSVEDLVNKVVAMTNQTVVDSIKSKSPTFSLTEEEAQEVYNRVYAMIKDILSSEQILYIENKYTSLNTGLQILIESAVAAAKSSAPMKLYPLTSEPTTVDTSNIEIDIPITDNNTKNTQKSSTPKKKKPSKPKTPHAEKISNEKKETEQKSNVVEKTDVM